MHRVRGDEQKGVVLWDAAACSAQVVRAKGKFIGTMGFSCDGHFLFPEEAVFLADHDEINLVTGGEDESNQRVVPREEVFGLLDAGEGIDMKAYTVYAVLREQRFHVYRHGCWKVPDKSLVKDLPAPRVVRVPGTQPAPTATKRVKHDEDADVLFVSYDVYNPQSGFSKNKMSTPDFSLLILSADSHMPSVASLRRTLAAMAEGVPLRMCIVGDSSVTFVEVSDFEPTNNLLAETDLKKARPAPPKHLEVESEEVL